MTATENGHLSRLLMARLVAGDLDAGARTHAESHLRGCAKCNASFVEAGNTAAAFARKHPTFESLAAGRRGRAATEAAAPGLGERLRGAFDRVFGLRPALAALSVLVVAGLLWNFGARNVNVDLTAKGGAHFFLVLNGKETRGDEIACKPSDTIQLGITSPEPVYYAVLYRDDAGDLSLYMGGEGEAQKPLGLSDGETLPHSLVLDGGWGAEVLYCVWSEHPFTEAQARDFVGSLPKNPPNIELHAQIFQLKNARI